MCAKSIENKLMGLYTRGMGYALAKKLKEHESSLRPLEQAYNVSLDNAISNIKTVRDFDHFYTSKVHGYKTPNNYYRQTSLGLRLQEVSIPCFLLSSLDDPIVPY